MRVAVTESHIRGVARSRGLHLPLRQSGAATAEKFGRRVNSQEIRKFARVRSCLIPRCSDAARRAAEKRLASSDHWLRKDYPPRTRDAFLNFFPPTRRNTGERREILEKCSLLFFAIRDAAIRLSRVGTNSQDVRIVN